VPPRFRREDAPLSARERDILTLTAEGRTGAQIAETLAISPHTVRTHLKNIRVKLDAPTITAAVATAMRRGWIHPHV
jgi:DNA-binding CsgD family transcriptional regulator